MRKSLDDIRDTCRDCIGIINQDVRFDQNEEKKKNITFSFKIFCTKSLRNDFFNNCYETRKKSISSSKYLLESFRDLSGRTLNEIQTDSRLSDRYRYHSIDNAKEVERIARVQIEGYGVNKEYVEQQENSYYQLEFAPNGHRLIMTKLGSVFIPLFIDNNHLIYNDSSRDKDKKMKYKIPFAASDDFLDECGDGNDFDFIKELIEEYRRGKISSKEEFLAQWKQAYGV